MADTAGAAFLVLTEDCKNMFTLQRSDSFDLLTLETYSNAMAAMPVQISHIRVISASSLFVASLHEPRLGGPHVAVVRGLEHCSQGFHIVKFNDEAKWVVEARAPVQDRSELTAVHVLERSERKEADSQPVMLLGYQNGTCELRNVGGLEPTNLNVFSFAPYVAPEAVKQVTENGAQDSTIAMDIPILAFAISPNSVEILVAKQRPTGTSFIDLFRYDHDGLEVATSSKISRSAIVRCLSTKFTLAILNGQEYADLAFAWKENDLAGDIINKVYQFHSSLCEAAESVEGEQPPKIVVEDTSLLALQLAMHRAIPLTHPLAFNTEAALHISSIAAQCLSAFEHQHLASARIEKMIETGNLQALEPNGSLNTAMVLRKDCVQHLVSLQIWIVKFITTLLRQLYSVVNMHENNDRAAEEQDDAQRIHDAMNRPTILPLLFHSGVRQALIAISLVMIYLFPNIRLRATLLNRQDVLFSYYMQMAEAIKGTPLKFPVFARFLFDLGREVQGSLQQSTISDARRKEMERTMMLKGTLDEQYRPAAVKCKTMLDNYVIYLFENGHQVPPTIPTAITSEQKDLLHGPSVRFMFGFARTEMLGLGQKVEHARITLKETSTVAGMGGDAGDTALRMVTGGMVGTSNATAAVAVGLDQPSHKRRTVDDIRSKVDVVSKRTLRKATAIRQCTRCLQYARLDWTSPLKGEEIELGEDGVASEGNAMDIDSKLAAAVPGDRVMSLGEIGADLVAVERSVEDWQHRVFRDSCVCGGWWREVLAAE
ncbi:hypothetical protein HKX48_007427 [Thoreauomyces humboldtii]|nr:hypothetical protein HKX48_007427 [Thoreauomyces humboldtii]